MASGPEPTDWLAGQLRGLHPLRYLLCLVGLLITGLSAIVVKSSFDGGGMPDLPGWWQQPIKQARALLAQIFDGSVSGIFRGGLLLALNTALWCLIGGWIARHELLARRRRRYDVDDAHLEPSPMALLVGWWKSLVWCCPIVLPVALFLVVPVVLAGWVNTWLDGLGALAVSLLLPVVLAADLMLFFVALGAVAWPLMPMAIAAECGDVFDALSRSYSYAFQSPVRFLLLTATALALAGLPLGVLYAFAEQMMAWQPAAHQTSVLLAGSLRQAILDTPAGGTVDFQPGLAGTITLATGGPLSQRKPKRRKPRNISRLLVEERTTEPRTTQPAKLRRSTLTVRPFPV
jgi:hypothetical protein